jgi:hypothetical protein
MQARCAPLDGAVNASGVLAHQLDQTINCNNAPALVKAEARIANAAL